MNEEKLIKLRILIAEKEFITAQANHQLSQGGWTCDWSECARLNGIEIESLIASDGNIGYENKRIAELETAQSDSFRYALELAVSLHKKHFYECVDWEPSDTLIGLLTQIDNMTTGWINKDSETSNEGRKQ